jgi:hypothetical protein
MSLGNRDESPPAARRRPAVRLQGCFHSRAIPRGLDDSRAQLQGNVHRRRAFQENVEVRRHRARRRIRTGLLLEVVRRGPVAVAIEERAADSAVQDAVERLVVRLRAPFADQGVAFDEAPDAQSPLVGRPATEALVLRRVPFLQALHGGIVTLRKLQSNRLHDPRRASPGNGKLEMRNARSCAPVRSLDRSSFLPIDHPITRSQIARGPNGPSI